MTNALSLSSAGTALKPTAGAVWDRLWRHQPDAGKDDALLAREESSPRWHNIVRRIEAAFGSLEGLKSIELGSGRGDFSALLAQRGAEVTLFDSSAKALDQARQRFERLSLRANFVTGDMLGDLRTLQGRFHLSLSSGVIEHFQGRDRSAVIRAHSDALMDGGMTIISVPNAWCVPYRVWKLYLELRHWWPYGMEIPYSAHEIKRRASQIGLNNVNAQCFGFWESIRIHWMKGLFHLPTEWPDRDSPLDRFFGLALVLFARRAAAESSAPAPTS